MLKTRSAVTLVSIALLVLAAAGRWPYGFYTFLRIVVCGSAVYMAAEAYQTRDVLWTCVMGAAALLFNPLVPVYLRRSQWRWFDVFAIVVFILSLRFIRSERDAATRDTNSGMEA
jgi:hypothetical protein